MNSNHSRTLHYVLLTTLLTGSLAACDKVNDIQKAVAEKSNWEYSEAVDKMSQAKTYEAVYAETSKDVPLVQTTAKVICVPEADDFSFHIEITTHNSKPEPNGILKPMPMKMETLGGGQQGMFARMLLSTTGTIPEGTTYDQYTSVNLRINEKKSSTQLLENIPAISTEFNNQVYLFPFLIEKVNGIHIYSLRVAINTNQGTPNILIPFEDQNVAKVIEACKKHRIVVTERTSTEGAVAEKPGLTNNGTSVEKIEAKPTVTPVEKQTANMEASQNSPINSANKAAVESTRTDLTAKEKELKPIEAASPAKGYLTEMLRNAKSAYKVAELKAQLEALPKPATGDRRSARKLNDRALIDLKESNYSSAIDVFKQALTSDPADVEIRNNYLYALIKGKMYGEAESVAGELLSISPGRSSAWTNLAELYAQTERSAESVAALILAFQFSSNKDKTILFLNENIANDNSPLQKQSSQAIAVIKTL